MAASILDDNDTDNRQLLCTAAVTVNCMHAFSWQTQQHAKSHY